jgi:hypothetical protein
MKTSPYYVIENVSPPRDGQIVQCSGAPRRYLLAVHGVSTRFYTDLVDTAERHPTRAAAKARLEDLFMPGYMKVTKVG